MKTARTGTALGLAAMLLAGCGVSGAYASLDSGAETRNDTMGGAADAFTPGDATADVSDPRGDASVAGDAGQPSPPSASFENARDFAEVAECPPQVVNGVRFRTAGPVRRLGNEADELADDGCVALGPTEPGSVGGTFVSVESVAFAASPVVYASLAASPGGDGTALRPYQSLAQALAHSPAPRTIVLGPGAFQIPGGETTSALVVTSELTIIGRSGAEGAMQTIVTPAMGGTAVALRGAAASLSLVNVSLQSPVDSAPLAVVEGGSLYVQHSTLTGGSDVVRVSGTGASAEFSHALLRGGRDTSVRALAGARVLLRQTRAEIGSVAGVLAEGSSVSALEAAVLGDPGGRRGGEGITLVGATNTSTPDRLDRVVVRYARGVGLRVSGAGRRVLASFVELTNTDLRTSDPAAGAFVTDGAELSIDDGFARSNQGVVDPTCGTGSVIGGNQGYGVIASGATLQLNGALVEANGGPGVVAQDGATVPRFELVTAQRNIATNVIVMRSSLVGILDDTIREARAGALALDGEGAFDLGGVGFVLATVRPLRGSVVSILDDTIHDNGVAGAVFVDTPLDIKDLDLGMGVGGRLFATDLSRVLVTMNLRVGILDDTIFPAPTLASFNGLSRSSRLRLPATPPRL